MNCPVASPLLDESLAAVLKGECVTWSTLGLAPDDVLNACADHDLTPLLHQRLSRDSGWVDWPQDLREVVAREARADAARELLRRKELVCVLDALADAGIHPILLKGTPLAYSVYEIPSARPRGDTDLLIPRERIDAVRQTMAGLGYVPTLYSEGEVVFCQFELRKTDGFGVDHAFDVHWKISTQSLFADLFSYGELAADARAVPALGPHARTAGPPHALLLACVHAAMHHRNVPRVLWLYDIHLLASPFSAAEFEHFVDLAMAKKVTAIVTHALTLARELWRTSMPECAIERLHAANPPEPSASYLLSNRSWRHELVSNVRGLSAWHERVCLLREVLFPSPAYMLRSYGFAAGMRRTVLLPALYVHRLLRGAGKVLHGRK